MTAWIQKAFAILLLSGFAFSGYAGKKASGPNGDVQPFPLFLPNQGQIAGLKSQSADEVLFYVQGSNYNMYFREKGISYVFLENNKEKQEGLEALPVASKAEKGELAEKTKRSLEGFRLDMDFAEVSEQLQLKGEEQARPRFNYYYGHCPDGVTNVKGFKELIYKDVYKGIDIRFYFKGEGLKYDIKVEPGADPREIAFQYQPAAAIELENSGKQLTVKTPVDTLYESIPHAFQTMEGEKHTISCNYQLRNNGLVSYQFEKDYRIGYPLTIDPLIRSWSTFFGMERIESIDNGPRNDVYLTGQTDGTYNKFPTTSGTFQYNHQGKNDVLISKLDSSGSSLVWSTFYGGNNNDRGKGISVQGGLVAVTGMADTTFPLTSGAFQSSIKGNPNTTFNTFHGVPFLLLLDSGGTRKWATAHGKKEKKYVAANVYNQGNDVDIQGDIIAFTGKVRSDSFSTTANAYQTSCKNSCGGYAEYEAFLVIFDTTGVRQYATYLRGLSGSSYTTIGNAISINNRGYICLGGYTEHNNFPTKSAYQSFNKGNWDAFITVFDEKNNLVFSTLLGNNDRDLINSVELKDKYIYFGGKSDYGSNQDTFPVTNNAFQKINQGDYDGIIGKIDTTGQLYWSTYIGGSGWDVIYDVSFNSQKNILYFTGASSSSDFPVSSKAYQKNLNQSVSGKQSDVIFGKFTQDGIFQYSTYYGGGDSDDGKAISQDNAGNLYIGGDNIYFGSYAGDSFSVTNGAYQTSFRKGFLFKFKRCIFDSISIEIFGSKNFCKGDTLKVDSGYTHYSWYKMGTNEVIDTQYKATIQQDGKYIVRALDSAGCAGYDTIQLNVGDSADFKAPYVIGTKTLADSLLKVKWISKGTDSFFSSYNLYRKREDKSQFQLLDSFNNFYDSIFYDITVKAADSLYYTYYLTMENLCNDSAFKSNKLRSIYLDTLQVKTDSVEYGWNKPYDSFQGVYYLIKETPKGNNIIESTLDTSLMLTTCRGAGKVKVRYLNNGDTFSSNTLNQRSLISLDTPSIHNVNLPDNHTVKLNWAPAKPSSKVDRYIVRRKDDSANYKAIDTVHGRTDTVYRDSFANKIKESHCYRIQSMDSCGYGKSTRSPKHCALYLKTKTPDCGAEIRLDWNAYKGWDSVSQYKIYRKKPGNKQKFIASLDNTTNFIDTGVKYHQRYCYQIKGLKHGGSYEAFSNDTCDKAFEPNAPFVKAVSKQTTYPVSGKVKITWNNQQGKQEIHHQRLYYQDPDSTKFHLLKDSIPLTQDSFIHDSLNTKFKDHRYYLTTVDSCGNESDSAGIHKTMDLEFDVGQLLHDLSWTPYEGWPVKNYLVQRRQGGAFRTLDSLPAGDTSIFKQPEPCNFAINYRIKAIDSQGNYAYSDTGINEALDTLEPDAATLINISIQNDTVARVQFNGADSLDIFAYDVMRKQGNGNYQLAQRVIFDSAGGNFTVYDTANTLPGQLCYKILTQDSCLNTVTSDSFCAPYLQRQPGNYKSVLNWQRFDGYPVDSQYLLRYNGTVYDTLARFGSNDTNFVDTPLPCNIAQRYKVLSFEQGGNRTSTSNPIDVIPHDSIHPEAPYVEAFSVKGPDSAKVTWQLSDGDVYRYELSLKNSVGNSAAGSWQVVDTVGVQTSYTFSGLNTLDSQYCTRIVAIDSCSANRSPFSKAHCAIQLTGNPGQKENHLNWTSYEGWDSIQAYYVYNQNPKNPGWQVIGTLSGTDTSYTHADIPCNRPQHYKVEGKNDSGFTVFSDSLSLKPFDTIAPDAPEINHVSVSDSNTIEGHFDTSNALDLGAYVIYAKTGSNPYKPIDTIADTGQAQNHFIHSGIRPDTIQYCYRIKAIDSCSGNLSNFSDPHCTVELQGQAGNLETELQWQPYTGFSNPDYAIQRKSRFSAWQQVGNSADTTFNDTTAEACNAVYTYRIMTVAPSSSDTSYSDTLQLKPFDTTAPPVPQLRFASANLQDEVEVKWEWNQSSNQKYFEVWRDNGDHNYAVQDTVVYASLYLDQSVNPNMPYSYYVRAMDSCSADSLGDMPGNRSMPSDTDRLIVPKVATGACLPEARLSWTPYQSFPQGTDYYKIYRQQPATNNAFQQIGTSPDTSFTDTAILDGNEYCYRIEAVDTQSGYTAFSDSICMQPFVYPIPDTARIKRTTVVETGQSNGEILVEWERAPKSDTFARGYYIYHRQGGGSYQLIANISDLADTTYRHRGINTAKFPHEYRVVIYNLCLEDGGYRKVHRPVKMYGENRNLEVALDWLPYQGFDVQKYEVQRSVNGGPYRSLDTLMSTDTSYRDSSVRCGNQYAYRIYAEGSKGHEQSLSDSIGFVAYDTIPPARADINKGTITQTGTTNGIAEVSFEPASQANRKGYIIYRSEDNSRFVPVDTVFSNSTNTITYSDSNLNTHYSLLGYYIRSFDSCGNVAAPSDTHRLINLKAEAMNLANEVSWTAYQGWDDWLYELQRRTPNTNWTPIARHDTGNRSFTDSTENCDTLYYYRVKAINANTGGVSFSNYDTVTSIDQKPPQPPEPERVTVEADGSVRIEWKASSSPDAANADLFKKPSSAANFEPRTTNLQTTNYTDSQSSANEEPISYRLRSEDSCNNISDPSDVHTTIHLEAEPGQEQNELTWTAYEGWDVKSYEVYKDGNQVAELGSDQRSYTDVRAVCTTYHNYRIRAIKQGGEDIFSWSNTDSAQARDNTPPQAVNLTTATVVEPNEVVEVRWEAATAYDADGYEIYRSGLNSTGLIQIATIEGAETTRFRDSIISPVNEQFCYQVRVRDFCGNRSKRSNNGCVMGIEGDAKEGVNQISWNEYSEWPGDIAYYEIYKKEDSSFYEQIGRTEETNYSDENLKNRVTDFCYQVEAHHSEGDETSRSFEICLRQPQIIHIPNSFTPGITEGKNDEFGPEGLYIESYEMQIFNRWGEEIFSTESSEPWGGTYEGKLAPAGVYLYSITVIGENDRRESYNGSLNVVR